MNINWNRKYFTIAVYATCAVIVSAIAVMVIFNFDSVMAKLSVLGAVTTPIIIGIFCAYLLNPLMTRIETGPLKKLSDSTNKKNRSQARGIALTLTMLLVLVILGLIVIMVIPQLIENLIVIFSNMDSYINTIKEWLSNIFDDNPTLVEFLGNPLDDFNKFIAGIWKEYSNELMNIAGNVASTVWAVIDTMKNVLIGLIISIYLLARKEMFIGQTKKLIFAFLKVERAQRFLGVCREASKKFLGSIVGKIIEAFIVAMICFIGCTIPPPAVFTAYRGDNVRVQSDTVRRSVHRRYPVYASAASVRQADTGAVVRYFHCGATDCRREHHCAVDTGRFHRTSGGVDTDRDTRRRRSVRHAGNVPGSAGLRGGLHAVQGFHRGQAEKAAATAEDFGLRPGRGVYHAGLRLRRAGGGSCAGA